MSDSQSNEKTPWFPSTIKPVRKGFYESHWLIGSNSRLRYWDGELWLEDGQACGKKDYTWRGLAHPDQDQVDDRVATHIARRRPIPHEVVNATTDGITPTRAWRQYLGLKQAEVAARMGISQPDYSQYEAKVHLSESSREKIGAALGITADQLDF
ncbi:helix-turn-helix domain-containing protein [Paraburkholderia sp. BL21I4N1]|uniref:helix-turn-helix domain-containing protein n=1 Tax=Paraburkholderia sp. BL21I4N1 TaxID=1938801 RepID=UPI000D4D1E34|nr:helix-turn-helix transcriptional regulator [Paraburkholderia sp. BL21I4N1]PQV44212.1 helix-turn-helix protein [Paraburkholderia sp. BL21I4N1]